MDDFEKLGVFYLGRLFDLEGNSPRPELLLYNSKDLTTHAVCVGMTGSGKTGLCLALLEEAAIDGIPAIAIDPKGDLGNLLLAFPNLKGSDFLPWIDPEEAARRGESAEQFAEKTAERWRKGLAEWQQTPDRISRYLESADISIYTPGSSAGLPLTVLRDFAAPAVEIQQDAEALRERVLTSVTGLLGLLGITADPLRSREHTFLSNLLERAWSEGRSLDLADLIREIQSPPFDKIGVMDLESMFPAKDRYALAMQLNNLLASPGFAAWREGEPLNIQRLLYTPEGRPRLTVISIAHLDDAQRMFFVTTLLNEVIAWMRTQAGTSSLRALLYMDEVFGYFPPTANPPSKQPMLTLLKQARAFGLGVVLATQNPVDLDYKGLSNAGTWFLGRLQTERDKARVLDGLEGVAAGAGSSFDRAGMERALSALGNRVFLMNNVHEDAPVVFQSRWALSYLRGPLTRAQIETLMRPRKTAAAPSAAPAASSPAAATPSTAPGAAPLGPAGGSLPVLPPGVTQRFVKAKRAPQAGGTLVYRPALYGRARMHYTSAPLKLDEWQTKAFLVGPIESVSDDVWEDAATSDALQLDNSPASSATFAQLPSEMTRPKSYDSWKTALKNYLYQNASLDLLSCASLKATSRPGESEGDFRVRLRQLVAEQRDKEMEKLRTGYGPKVQSLEQRIRRAEQQVDREKAQSWDQKLNTFLSFGSAILNALFGRKLSSTANVTRATSSMKSASRAMREHADVARAEENATVLKQQLADIDAELQAATSTLREKWDVDRLEIVENPIKPKKTDLSVEEVSLVWTPWIVDANGIAEPAY